MSRLSKALVYKFIKLYRKLGAQIDYGQDHEESGYLVAR